MKKTSDLIWQDVQHQILFQLLDEVAEVDSALEVLHKLKLYAESHFYLEEQYMQLLDYPGREVHLRAHDRFREELDKMEPGAEEHDQLSREVISIFLREWLTRHIFGIDKELEAFILESGAR